MSHGARSVPNAPGTAGVFSFSAGLHGGEPGEGLLASHSIGADSEFGGSGIHSTHLHG